MRFTSPLLSSITRRLVPAVYGITKKGVHVQTQFQADLTSAGVEATVQVGEDAAFVSVSHSNRYHVCGVADGVGGWNNEGIDPSYFSKVLMESCCRVSTRKSVNLTNPVQILTRALKEVQWFHSKSYGSSTACIMSLDCSTGILYSANLGDSGYTIIRNGEIIAESQTLIHYFNCPYQFSNPPPGFNTTGMDKPSSAKTSSVEVEEGDLIVLATDGLFDNMYISDIAASLKEFAYSKQDDLEEKVKEMAEMTYNYSKNSSYMSPFAKQGSQMLSWEYQGGKPGDITIILAAITNCSDQNELHPP